MSIISSSDDPGILGSPLAAEPHAVVSTVRG
jgi:hypothetical protein